MSIAEIRKLSVIEKMLLMEALWEDLRTHIEEAPIPGWHRRLLGARREALKEGREAVLDWDEVKRSLPRPKE